MISNLVNSKLSPEDIIFFLNKTNTSIQTLQCSVFNKGHLQTFNESWTDGSDFTQLPSSLMWARIQSKKKKKRKKIINKAVELCVIQAEVCASWWEDWSFTFRQTVRKCFKPSMAKRSTSVCYTPNDARAEPRLPKLSEGFCFYCDPLHRPGYYPHYLTTTPLDSMHRQSECILTIISSAGRTSSSAYQQVITMELEISSIRFLSLGSAHLLEGGVVGFFF